MANTPVPLVAYTISNGVAQSASLATSGTSVATGNTGVIAAVGNSRQLVISVYGDGASTLTFLAGDEPPSEDAGKGNSSALTIGSGLSYEIVLEAGRFVQDDGTILALVGGTGPVHISPRVTPRGV